MKKYFFYTTLLNLLILWPTQAQEIPLPVQLPGSQSAAIQERLKTISEATYLTKLTVQGKSLESQGLYIESLDGSTVFADHQSEIAFNPASVIKVATSFAALDRFGPDFQFETAFLAAGEIAKKTKTLNGDLVLVSTGDPELTTVDVNRLIRQVIQAGVTRVTGSLVLTGPFSYSSYYTTLDAVRRLEAALKKLGVRVAKGTRLGAATGTVLASHKSAPLREIVYIQNVHSNNQTAERLGEALGGPWAVQEFLLRTVGIPSNEIHISRTSGLEYNRITPRATVKLLRHLVLWLNLRNLLPQDVLPIAGMQGGGTLSGRFTSVDYRGAVVGKTGTLPATDGGVSTLAGFLYTKDRGVILFAIFNTHGNVNTYRHMQDNLLKDLIVECGGADVTLSASWRKSNN